MFQPPRERFVPKRGLPSRCFKRIFDLAHEPFFYKAPAT
jgi:hypothetical protein